MTAPEPVTGAEFLARSLAANGTTHVFFIDAVLRRTLIELGTLGVQRVLGHSEKAVAYMADGYARIAGRPGICFAQSVGAANLASGLQDAWLGRAPVIAMTGHKQPWMQHRNAYQEIPHAPLFIIGHWRSGTTFLHELMYLDKRFVSPTTYQCFAPHHCLLTEGLMNALGGWLMPKQRPMDNILLTENCQLITILAL